MIACERSVHAKSQSRKDARAQRGARAFARASASLRLGVNWRAYDLKATEHLMDQPVDRLTLQFLAWLDSEPRTYGEAMDAWRSTCPRLSVWEDALAGGLIQVDSNGGTMRAARVSLAPRGRGMLRHAAAHSATHTGAADRSIE